MNKDILPYMTGDGLVTLSTDRSPEDNLLLFTCEWYLIDPTITSAEAMELKRKIMDGIIFYGYLPRLGKKEMNPCSYDDFIGTFAFLYHFGFRRHAKFIYEYMQKLNWNNGGVSVWRFFHMRSFAKFCAYGECNLWDQIVISTAFLLNCREPREETSGRLLLRLIMFSMQARYAPIDAVIALWQGKLRTMYRDGWKDVMRIYFPRNSVFRDNVGKEF